MGLIEDLVNNPRFDQFCERMERYPYSDLLRDNAEQAGIRIVYVDCTDDLLSYRCELCKKRHTHPWLEAAGDLGPRPSRCPHYDGLYQLLPKEPIVWWLPPVPV
jgi:hypothetical protein